MAPTINQIRKAVMKRAWAMLRSYSGRKATPRSHPAKFASWLRSAWRAAKQSMAAAAKPEYAAPAKHWSRQPSRYFSASVYASFGQ